MQRELAYTGKVLDRAAIRRGDDQWLLDQAAGNPRILVLWKDMNLISHGPEGQKTPDAAVISGDHARSILQDKDPVSEAIFLGLLDENPIFAVDYSEHDEAPEQQVPGIDSHYSASFTDLRSVGPIIDQHTGSMLAFARGMAFWHRRHRFCGACGSPTVSRSGGFMRTCANAACGLDHFPRTDPAVIMLVTAALPAGEHCLLGRQPSWDLGMYSSLAGFVEPGESLEHAVEREVMEEASIRVTDVTYCASQPWPFPSSLMLGFRARATTFDINVGEDELEDARWFSRAALHERARINAGDKRLSRADSIARWLIEEWLHEA